MSFPLKESKIFIFCSKANIGILCVENDVVLKFMIKLLDESEEVFYRAPGLPDGLLSDQKLESGHILESLAMQDVGVFYGHLVYFMDIWYILQLFDIFYGHLLYFVVCSFVHFSQFWYFVPINIWQPCRALLNWFRGLKNFSASPFRETVFERQEKLFGKSVV
jgi:hypothetical protein